MVRSHFSVESTTRSKFAGTGLNPAEIAAAINAHAWVTTSAVMARTDGGDDKRLVGYLVANGNLTRNKLQGFLLDRLPDYMVPSVFVVLDSLPLTVNGKVDYSVLPPPTSENTLRDESGDHKFGDRGSPWRASPPSCCASLKSVPTTTSSCSAGTRCSGHN